jgi:hypothetical protein
MKKLVLFAICLGFSAITFAQSTIKPADAGVLLTAKKLRQITR